MLTDKSEQWNAATSSWLSITNIISVYNAAHSLLSNTVQFWDGSTWKPYTRMTYTYDAGERVLTNESENYDFSAGALKKLNKNTFTYTASGKQATITGQNWNAATSAYVNNGKYSYTYDASDRVKEIITQDWVAASSSWVNESRYFDFTYNATGKTTFYNYYAWISGAWMAVERFTFTFDAADLVVKMLDEAYEPSISSWYTYGEEITTYSASGDMLSFIDKEYVSGLGDFLTTRNRSTYNGSHQKTRSVDDHFSGTGYYYEVNDKLVRYHYTETPTAIEEDVASNTEVIIYPVPANEQCMIAVKSLASQNFSIVVYDIAGHIWQQETHSAQTNYTGTINTKEMPAGNYFVNVQNADGSRIVKAISVMH